MRDFRAKQRNTQKINEKLKEFEATKNSAGKARAKHKEAKAKYDAKVEEIQPKITEIEKKLSAMEKEIPANFAVAPMTTKIMAAVSD